MNGIYAKFVELVTRGTTLALQFAFVIAKTVAGARMAGKVRFQHLDAEPRFYTALIGESGSGKGEAWRRTEKILRPEFGRATGNFWLPLSEPEGEFPLADESLETWPAPRLEKPGATESRISFVTSLPSYVA